MSSILPSNVNDSYRAGCFVGTPGRDSQCFTLECLLDFTTRNVSEDSRVFTCIPR